MRKPRYIKYWEKENKKTGISFKEWWELNKHRDPDEELQNKLMLATIIVLVITNLLKIFI